MTTMAPDESPVRPPRETWRMRSSGMRRPAIHAASTAVRPITSGMRVADARPRKQDARLASERHSPRPRRPRTRGPRPDDRRLRTMNEGPGPGAATSEKRARVTASSGIAMMATSVGSDPTDQPTVRCPSVAANRTAVPRVLDEPDRPLHVDQPRQQEGKDERDVERRRPDGRSTFVAERKQSQSRSRDVDGVVVTPETGDRRPGGERDKPPHRRRVRVAPSQPDRRKRKQNLARVIEPWHGSKFHGDGHRRDRPRYPMRARRADM